MTKDLGFIRIHHSHIININYIENYFTKDGGFVDLIERTTLPVSKRKKNDLLEAIKTYFN
ncbi:LytTR family transcriptional regulator DNA-binding domain-containing protein [Flavobacterium sp.]|uniref:LytTR family transcriptional regulator DNA-binding domain-containing protein n=1 Tax=Flavobacterium sp. TaxID=239 RepID=UPI00404827BB